MSDKLYTMKETAQLVGKSYDAVRWLCISGQVEPRVKCGHIRLFNDSDIATIKRTLDAREGGE